MKHITTEDGRSVTVAEFLASMEVMLRLAKGAYAASDERTDLGLAETTYRRHHNAPAHPAGFRPLGGKRGSK